MHHGALEASPDNLRASAVNMEGRISCGQALRGSLRTISVPVTDRQSMTFEVQVIQKLQDILGATQEINHDVKCLHHQVHTLQGSVLQPSRESKTVEPKHPHLSTTAATFGHDKADVLPKPVGIAQDASGEDFDALKRLASALDMSLQRHNMIMQSATSDARLEHNLKEVLKQCEASNASCERIESMLQCETPSGGKDRPSEKMKGQQLDTQTLIRNSQGSERGGTIDLSDALQISSDVHHTAVKTTEKAFVGDITGFGARGWIAQSADSAPQMTILQMFNRVSVVLVVVDLIMASVTAHIQIDRGLAGRSSPEWIAVYQMALALAFGAELSGRWCILRSQFFKGPDCKWNTFDLVITGISLLDAALTVTKSGTSLAHVTFLRLLRLLRLVRVANVFRKLRDLYEFGLIVECLANALLPIGWSFLLVGSVLYLSTVLLLQLLEPHVHSETEVDSDIVRLYGGFGPCIYTLLLAISGGMPWQDLVQPLACLSGWFTLTYVIYIFFVNFFVFNILAAVFVSYVAGFVKKHHEQFVHDGQVQALSSAEQLRQVLQMDAEEHQGRMSARRLEKLLTQNDALMDKLELNISTALGIFKMLQRERSTHVDVDEFICSLVQVKGNPTGIHVVTMMYETKRIIHRIDALQEQLNVSLDTLLGEDP